MKEVLQKLHGDASTRTYSRGKREDGSTFIVMQMPAGKMSVSEEITNLKERPRELPFLNIARFLRSHDLPVPEVLEFREKEGQILLEDLGDSTLETVLHQAEQRNWKGWYQKAIDLLIRIQSIPINRPADCIALQRSFDATLYNWEFDHFWEYYVEKVSRPASSDRGLFEAETRKITKVLLGEPLVFTHRDFQSRNLMVQEERLRLIDFQDALLGPAAYDLVALLRDSYIELDGKMVDQLIGYYLEKRAEPGGLESFKRVFDYLTIQRKLKDAGRFVYIDQVKQNRSFLKFIPASLRYVKQALERRHELQPLLNLLKKYVPELQ